MAYNKTVWHNDMLPAINQTNLNKIEQGIYDADERSANNETNIGDLTQLQTTDKTNLVNAINEVNQNDKNKGTYSTEEQRIGTWIDGKKIYRKVISIGSLPNDTSKSIPTEIDFNNATLVKMYGFCKYQSNNTAFPLPFAHPVVIGYSIMLNIDNNNNIVVTTGTDRTGYFGYVVLEYTKNN